MICIIVDDEPNAIDILKRYVMQTPFLQLLETFRNPMKAISFMQDHSVDLIFLDINMPNLSGIQFIKTLEKKPLIILTTAYSEYAVESYELNVTDYLVKPIEFERFLKAGNKANELLKSKSKRDTLKHSTTIPNSHDYILLKSGSLTHKVAMEDILFIEKEENYLAFNTTYKKILVRGNMNDVFEYVSTSLFCRIHKSFVIAIKHISTIEIHQVVIGKYKIPIGGNYREELMEKLKNN